MRKKWRMRGATHFNVSRIRQRRSQDARRTGRRDSIVLTRDD